MSDNNKDNDITLEELFGRIEGLIEELEYKDISIEDAFEKYESGMKLLSQCNERLDTIEKKVLSVNASGELKEFE